MKEEISLAKKILSIFWILFSVSSLVGFTMFIFEEAMQQTTFTAKVYMDGGDWEGLESHLQTMYTVDLGANAFIRAIGWLNPVMYPAYLKYLDANRGQILAIERRLVEKKGKGIKFSSFPDIKRGRR